MAPFTPKLSVSTFKSLDKVSSWGKFRSVGERGISVYKQLLFYEDCTYCRNICKTWLLILAPQCGVLGLSNYVCGKLLHGNRCKPITSEIYEFDDNMQWFWLWRAMWSTVLCYVLLGCTVLCYAMACYVIYCAVLCFAGLHCVVLCHAVYSVVLFITVHKVGLGCIPWYYRVIQEVVPSFLNFFQWESTGELHPKIHSCQIICLKHNKLHSINLCPTVTTVFIRKSASPDKALPPIKRRIWEQKHQRAPPSNKRRIHNINNNAALNRSTILRSTAGTRQGAKLKKKRYSSI